MEKMRVSQPHGHQGPHGAQGATASRGKPAAADGAGAGAGGNFLSLLSALGNDLLPEMVVSDVLPTGSAAVPGQEPVLPFAADPPTTDLTTLLAWQGQGLTPTDTPANPVVPTAISCFGQSQVPIEPPFTTPAQILTAPSTTTTTTPATTLGTLGLLPTGMSGSGTQGRGFPGASAAPSGRVSGASGASGGGELGLVAQTAAFDAVAETPIVQNFAGSTAAGFRRTFARGQSTVLQPSDTSAATGAAVAHKLAAIDHPTQTNTLAALNPTQAQAMTERRESVPLAGAGWQPSQTENFTSLMAAQGMLESGRGGGFSGRGGNGSAGSNSAEAGSSWGVGGAVASPTEMGFAEIGQALDASVPQGPEKAVAEQIAYWVNENIQNAELTVQHEGHPVEVSVSLEGKEAHVTFRTDQNETRELLDASMAQLRELLRNEGLELSGVTVGSSESPNNPSGNSGSRQREGQSGARQGRVEVPTATAKSPRPAVITDRAVDIFV